MQEMHQRGFVAEKFCLYLDMSRHLGTLIITVGFSPETKLVFQPGIMEERS